MKQKVEIFCQFEFLEKIYSKLTDNYFEFDENENSDIYIYLQLNNLIHKYSDLSIDKTYEELEIISLDKKNPHYNPYFKKLWKNGKIKFKNKPEIFEQMFEDETYFQNKTNELFFLNKTSEECKKLEENYGLIFIGKDEIETKVPFLFNWQLISFSKNKNIFTDWSFIKKFNHPFNSLIIADNFVLENKNFDNLFDFLNSFLPAKLENYSFNLTIFVDNKTFKTTEMINEFYNKISKKLEELRSYKFEFSLIGTHNIHDRNILTNYFWLSSGHGFDIFKNKITTKDTHISFIPITYLGSEFKKYATELNLSSETSNFVFQAAQNLLQHYKKISKTDTIYSCGLKNNRLLN